MGLTVRPFRPDDLQLVVALWNRCLTRDLITEERFWRLFLLDPNFDPHGALVAEELGDLAGYLQVVARKSAPLGGTVQADRGWLTAFFVAPERRRGGIGTMLLEGGLDWLRGKGRTLVTCNGYAPYYIAPGLDIEYAEALSFLEAAGFRAEAEPVAMAKALDGARTPERVQAAERELQAEGFEVRMFRREDALPLLAFAAAHFPEWQGSILSDLYGGNLEMVVATYRGEVVGYTQWQNTHTDPPHGAPGRFGPFGVRADFRGRGIGAVIFYRLIEHALASGARHLWFGWAGGRNLSFYEREGCVVTRRYKLMSRAI